MIKLRCALLRDSLTRDILQVQLEQFKTMETKLLGRRSGGMEKMIDRSCLALILVLCQIPN